jgi:NH3-dependent NAD+ synthetase
MNSYAKRLVASIGRDAAAASGLLIPVSGGSDSALCFWACRQALGDKVRGVYVGRDLRCRDWFDSVGKVHYLSEQPDWRDKEIMRWAEFLSLAKEENRWLTGSRTLTEEHLGTISMASRVATYLPLMGLWKSEVMVLCDAVGVPKQITASSRRADPDCGRPQEMAEIPLELIDLFLRLPENSKTVQLVLSPAQIDYLESVRTRNAFKRKLPARGKRIQVLRKAHLLSRARRVLAA